MRSSEVMRDGHGEKRYENRGRMGKRGIEKEGERKQNVGENGENLGRILKY